VNVLKLIIGNKAYSSWSLRGWLAVKQSGLPFEEITVPLFDEDWHKRREDDEFAPAGGKVPILWDDRNVIWDSLAIIEYLADKTDRARFWPADDGARGMARSMAAEMHSSYENLRREHSMNLRHRWPAKPLSEPVTAEVKRILELWAQARAVHGKWRPLSVRRLWRGRHHVRAGGDPLRHLFDTGAAFRSGLYGHDPASPLDAGMGRGGAGGTLGDRALRDAGGVS
jgi:glutathione S-transferase